MRSAIEQQPYSESQDVKCEDQFGSMTPGSLNMPSGVEVKFIDDESNCDALTALLQQPVIGLDCEWRPNLTKFIKTDPAILQISDATTAYIIDLLALKGSEKLAHIL